VEYNSFITNDSHLSLPWKPQYVGYDIVTAIHLVRWVTVPVNTLKYEDGNVLWIEVYWNHVVWMNVTYVVRLRDESICIGNKMQYEILFYFSSDRIQWFIVHVIWTFCLRIICYLKLNDIFDKICDMYMSCNFEQKICISLKIFGFVVQNSTTYLNTWNFLIVHRARKVWWCSSRLLKQTVCIAIGMIVR